MSTHDDLMELLDVLDDQLSGTQARDADWYQWSDGDKVRGFAHNQLIGSHMAAHLGAPLEIGHIRELMRIAARIDVLDEMLEEEKT